MYYELFAFDCPRSRDPAEMLDTLYEAAYSNDRGELSPHDQRAVAHGLAAYRAEFADVELITDDPSNVAFRFEDGLISADTMPTFMEIAIAYRVPKDDDWVIDRVTRIIAAARAAGHNTVIDEQLERAITLPEDRDVILAGYHEGVAEAAREAAATPRFKPGLLARLFGR